MTLTSKRIAIDEQGPPHLDASRSGPIPSAAPDLDACCIRVSPTGGMRGMSVEAPGVFRVSAMHSVAAWLVVQIADATFDVLGIPPSPTDC